MTKVAVKPEILRWARERAGLTVATLQDKFSSYTAWERGEKSPTFHQIEALAKKTLTPLGFFFLSTPPEEKLPIPDFRTVDDSLSDRPSPNLLATVYAMQRRQDWMRDYLIERGAEPLAFVGAAKVKDDPKKIAAQARKALGLEPDWAKEHPTWQKALDSLRDAIEEAGVLTVINGVVENSTKRKLDVNEFRGFVLCDRHAPLIFVNGSDAKAAQMFTLAHELAHLWLGQDALFNFDRLQPAGFGVELFCNQVTAEFLAPENDVRKAWPDVQAGVDRFDQLARQFKVSSLVMARRALDLDLIDRSDFLSFYSDYMADERRKAQRQKPGGDFYNTQNNRVGKRFAEIVFRAAKEGSLLYRDAYRLTGLHGAAFTSYAERIGIRL